MVVPKLRAVVALFGVIPVLASGATLRVVDIPQATTRATNAVTAHAAGDGYWLLGFASSDQTHALRYGSGDQPGAVHRTGIGTSVLAGTDDGGAVLVSTSVVYDDGCVVERRDAAFALRWRRHLQRCLPVVPSGEWTWVLGDRVDRFDASGAGPAQSIAGYDGLPVDAHGAGGGDIVLATRRSDAYAIERVRPDGTIAWSRSIPVGSASAAIPALHGDTQGVMVVVRGQREELVRLSLATGAIQWRVDVGNFSLRLDQATARTWVLNYGTGDRCVLTRIENATGAVLSREISLGAPCYDLGLFALDEGSAAVFARGEPASGVRAAAENLELTALPLPGPLLDAIRLGDGTARILTGTFDRPRLSARSPDGSWRELPAPPTAVPVAGVLNAVSVAPDGRVLALPSSGAGRRLVAFDPDGRLAWQVEQPTIRAGSAGTNGERACDASDDTPQLPSARVRVTCRSASAGTETWSRTFDAPGRVSSIRLRVLADGSVVTAWSDALNTSTSVKRLDPAGNVVAEQVTLETVRAINELGNLMVSRSGTSFGVVDAAGVAIYRYDEGSPELLSSSEGNEIATVRDGTLRQYSATGAVRSTTPVRIASGPQSLLATRDGAFVVEASESGRPGERLVRFVDATTGATRWQRTLADLTGTTYLAAAGRDAVAVLSIDARRLSRFTLARSDGRLLLQDDVACIPCAALPQAAFDADGRLYTFVASLAEDRARMLVDTLPESPRDLDARATAGAWYSPGLPGDGIVANMDPASGTFFAAWFTYRPESAPGPAGQHWYSLQGDVVAGAATVGIFDTTGGAFGTAGGATAAVGTARLRLVGCDRLELDYAFTNGLGSGRRSLVRLTDPARACAAASPPPANGLDWRQTAAWFDPATSGQGVLFSIDPAGPSFGAWFTFDPAAQADDPSAQQWLTLQSTGAPADAGAVPMTIFRTVDGRFARRPGVSTTRVGEAVVRFDGCARARLDYAFDDTLAAGSMRARNGGVDLQRIGACP